MGPEMLVQIECRYVLVYRDPWEDWTWFSVLVWINIDNLKTKKEREKTTLSFPSIFRTISSQEFTQFIIEGLEKPALYINEPLRPLAIFHRLSFSKSPVKVLGKGCWYCWPRLECDCGCKPVGVPRVGGLPSEGNKYDTPGCGDNKPRGPIICCAEWNGEGPRSLAILLYTSDKTSSRESRVCW